MKRTSIGILVVAFVASLIISTPTLAGKAEVKAAEAIASTIIYYEKCTGDGPSPAKMDRIVKSLLNAGMTPKEFQAGSKKATSEIESLYPGGARPPKRVCDEAQKLYNEVFGSA